MKVKDLVYMSMYVALCLVLDYVSQLIPFLQMPQGGSINLAVIPAVIASYHLGVKKGITVGMLWWVVGFILGLNQWYLNPAQYAFDYLIPAGICGVACIMPNIGRLSNIYTGVLFVNIIRFICTLLSGAYFWPPEGSVAGSGAAWIYSLSYNLYYNLGTLVVAMILVPLVMSRIKEAQTYVKVS